MSGATSVLPAPVRLLEEETFELELPPELELEPHAASASDAATAKSTELMRMSFFFMRRMLSRPSSGGVSEP
jgi:hypothetical protein